MLTMSLRICVQSGFASLAATVTDDRPKVKAATPPVTPNAAHPALREAEVAEESMRLAKGDATVERRFQSQNASSRAGQRSSRGWDARSQIATERQYRSNQDMSGNFIHLPFIALEENRPSIVNFSSRGNFWSDGSFLKDSFLEPKQVMLFFTFWGKHIISGNLPGEEVWAWSVQGRESETKPCWHLEWWPFRGGDL